MPEREPIPLHSEEDPSSDPETVDLDKDKAYAESLDPVRLLNEASATIERLEQALGKDQPDEALRDHLIELQASKSRLEKIMDENRQAAESGEVGKLDNTRMNTEKRLLEGLIKEKKELLAQIGREQTEDIA